MTNQDPWTALRQHWAACAKHDKDYRTADAIPLLAEMAEAYRELVKEGWRDIIYCPKDGTEFLCILAGNHHVHRCIYSGDWPKGAWWILEAGGMWPCYPILWKPLPVEK